jgi:hypothetical protein
VYNQLKDGGKCLLESQTSCFLDCELVFRNEGEQNRMWFNPSRLILLDLLKIVGFENLQVVDFNKNHRIQISAERVKWKEMKIQTGLSIPDIP